MPHTCSRSLANAWPVVPPDRSDTHLRQRWAFEAGYHLGFLHPGHSPASIASLPGARPSPPPSPLAVFHWSPVLPGLAANSLTKGKQISVGLMFNSCKALRRSNAYKGFALALWISSTAPSKYVCIIVSLSYMLGRYRCWGRLGRPEVLQEQKIYWKTKGFIKYHRIFRQDIPMW